MLPFDASLDLIRPEVLVPFIDLLVMFAADEPAAHMAHTFAFALGRFKQEPRVDYILN
jgi:hypothetical protein